MEVEPNITDQRVFSAEEMEWVYDYQAKLLNERDKNVYPDIEVPEGNELLIDAHHTDEGFKRKYQELRDKVANGQVNRLVLE